MAWPTNSLEIKHRVFALLCVLTSSPFEHPSVKCRVLSSAYLFTPCYAASNGELETSHSSRKDVEELLQELDISGEERSQLFKSIADAFIQSGQPQSAAIDAIALALCSSTLFDFDPLFKLDAVVSAKDREALSLLQVFLNSDLAELHSSLESHLAILEKYEFASILQIELSEVEKWAIDANIKGLLHQYMFPSVMQSTLVTTGSALLGSAATYCAA
ncbi:uncharacterized protein F5147DRAFT_650108 [Suillus discolor]|uniref:Uncharacterized protein n=1 Tax=Suillus discolor TaxID=1912936 RepID=A0A9P7JY05_9AGAM|nr:uncharacterized protein F5147DRAFT_650108 [Suillus discolor]KAG2114330.1 hypothetical protein F5147DRAFT_650108 [Suillus discolor]